MKSGCSDHLQSRKVYSELCTVELKFCSHGCQCELGELQQELEWDLLPVIFTFQLISSYKI